MPTAYTEKLMNEGQAFPDFVLLCARAMGATIMMRDDPLDAPIPEFQPSGYSANALSEAKAELAQLLAMSNNEKIAYGQAKRDSEIQRNQEWLTKELAQNERLSEMQAKVHEWTPPTADHGGLKDFMLEQIKISKNGTSYIRAMIADAEGASPVFYYNQAVTNAERLIAYHTEEDRKERERTDARNRWVRELRASLTP